MTQIQVSRHFQDFLQKIVAHFLKSVQLNFNDDEIAYRHAIESINNAFEKFADRFGNQAKRLLNNGGHLEESVTTTKKTEKRAVLSDYDAHTTKRTRRDSLNKETSPDSLFKKPHDPDNSETPPLTESADCRRYSGSSWSSSGYFSEDSIEANQTNELTENQLQQRQETTDIQIGTTIYNEEGQLQNIEWRNCESNGIDYQESSDTKNDTSEASDDPLATLCSDSPADSTNVINSNLVQENENRRSSETFKHKIMQNPEVQVSYEPLPFYRFERHDIQLGIPASRIIGSSLIGCEVEQSDIINCTIENSVITNSNIIDAVDARNRSDKIKRGDI
uniref:SPK domain-containing protein n=1 Tax=Caenorhabditis tropicalis TaxID=1561998 RepID=A0A1I7TTW4_9PELO